MTAELTRRAAHGHAAPDAAPDPAPGPGPDRDLRRQVAVVAGGCVASARTAGRLAAAGLEVIVITPDICPDMVDLLVERRVTWQRREADELDLQTPGVVFGVSDRPRRHPRPAPALPLP